MTNRLYFAPWERAFDRIATPFEEFLHRQTTIGILLIICAVTALVIANSGLTDWYHQVLNIKVAITFGGAEIRHSVHHWINDGLMTIFFFVVGLEIKREIMVGELSTIQNAMLPILAAIGGMVFPALFFIILNSDGVGSAGWGIPMATDIAFAVGVAALLGDRIPRSLLTFLVALAIVDDLGAVSVIAVFYTETINTNFLMAAGAILAGMIFLNRIGVRSPIPYFFMTIGLWFMVEGSGIHATVAGILAAWTIPAYARMKPDQLSAELRETLDAFDASGDSEAPLLNNPEKQKKLWQMDHTLNNAIAPLQMLESALHIPVTYIVIPLFALANAGIALDTDHMLAATQEPVAIGIVVGLVLGKLVGVSGVTLLAVKMGIGRLPTGVTSAHIIGAGLLAGIGFTMSIFIAELAFPGNENLLNHAKTGILAASLASGILGYLWLRFTPGKTTE
ncbi:MAG: Na+/H+ antiporter NhaA [Proteobacteria bacterium]|nr:Na+/H+ antiporter NhaA [Pseudomonadota bacterium]